VIAALLSVSKNVFTYLLKYSTYFEKSPNLVVKLISSGIKGYGISLYTQIFSVITLSEFNIFHKNDERMSAYSQGWFLQKGAIILGYYIFDPIVSFIQGRLVVAIGELVKFYDRGFKCDRRITAKKTQEDYE
jgi:hypothetical protein